MKDLIKMYYGIDCTIDSIGYFYVGPQLYYLFCVKDKNEFLNIYHYYRFIMHQCGITGYRIVKNVHQDIFSQNYVLLIYYKESFSFETYLHHMMQLYPFPKMKVQSIKEQWICKIDQARDMVKDYAYSFKHDQDIISLIYYYCGLGENSINVLNYILQIHQSASLPVTLSLSQPVSQYVYELLNPCMYIFSTRMRHLACLFKSQLLSTFQLQELLEKEYFDVYEIIYLYARMLYPSYFFQCLLQQTMDEKKISYFYFGLEEERQMNRQIFQVLSFYVTLPKISWINR